MKQLLKKKNETESTEQSDATKPDASPTSETVDAQALKTDSDANYEVTEQFLDKYVQRFPYQYSAWFQLAVLALRKKAIGQALDCLSKAIEAGWNFRKTLKDKKLLVACNKILAFKTLLLAMEDVPEDWTSPRALRRSIDLYSNGLETAERSWKSIFASF